MLHTSSFVFREEMKSDFMTFVYWGVQQLRS